MTTGVLDYNYLYNAAYSAGGAFNYDPLLTVIGPHGVIVQSPTGPLFNNLAVDDFSLASGSPLIGAGDNTLGAPYNTGLVPGTTFPNPALASRTGAWDIGAYVYGFSIGTGGGGGGGGTGKNAFTVTTTSPFTVPAVGASVPGITVEDASFIAPGQMVYVANARRVRELPERSR
jgi:hypothetical protein